MHHRRYTLLSAVIDFAIRLLFNFRNSIALR
jgi:hypothetical protein